MKIAPCWNGMLSTFTLLLQIWEVCPYFPLVLTVRFMCNGQQTLCFDESRSINSFPESEEQCICETWWLIRNFALSWLSLTLQFLCVTFSTPYVQLTVLISVVQRSSWLKRGFAHPSHHIKGASALSSSIYLFIFIIKYIPYLPLHYTFAL